MPKLLILLLSLLLTACASAPVVSVQNSPLPPASMLPVTEEAGDGLRYTVELETWEQSSQTEDGTPLVSCVYNLPAMHVVRADGSEVSEAGTEQETRALEVAGVFNPEFTAWTGETDFEELTQEANALGIGPQGMGGKTTVFRINIEQCPTHIAGLPCAVNISCHVTRHAKEVL